MASTSDSRPKQTRSTNASLCEKIASRDYTVGIMGLGYVGLPLALVAAKAGFKVIGFDTDATRVEQLNSGISAIKHISNAAIASAIAGGLSKATNDFAELAMPDAILIAVPTPLSRPHLGANDFRQVSLVDDGDGIVDGDHIEGFEVDASVIGPATRPELEYGVATVLGQRTDVIEKRPGVCRTIVTEQKNP